MKTSFVKGFEIVAFCVLLLVVASLPARALEAEFIDASELVEGEEGYGLTVLRGEEITKMPVKYIGTIQNAEPQRDLILIRLIGDTYEHTGVVAGMSGSPIYFRGRLLGALAYGWAFAKDPIAGVTSIHLMRKLIHEQTDPNLPEGMIALTPPLSVAGLSTASRGEAWKRIDALGFMAAPGGRTASRQTLRPGSAVGVKLIDGDISITAIGTVTYVEDTNVLAFGHPFLNRGQSWLPMCGARIETIMSSSRSSFKLGSAGEDLGVITRDGDPGICGMTGPSATYLPMSVSLATPWGGRKFSYNIAKDIVLTPQLIDIAWASSAEVGLFTMGPSGVEVGVKIHADSRVISMRDRGVVSQSVLEIMPTLPLHMLFDNQFGRFFPDSIEITVTAHRDRREGNILRARALRATVKPGETIPIEVVVRVFNEGERIERVEVPIPAGFGEGSVEISISGGRGLSIPEQSAPRNIGDIYKRLEAYEPSDMFVVRLSAGDGMLTAVEGGILPSLPPTVQRLQRGRSVGPASLGWSIPRDMPISGRASVRVEVKE